jgi:hypothetical protein
VRASLGALAQRLDRVVAALARRDAELEQTRASLSLLWRRVEQLERALRGAPGRPEPAPARRGLTPRVPIARAAAILGTSRKHALRLAADGLLDAADVRREGAPRAAWSVTTESLERLLEARSGRPGPLDQENGAQAGRRRSDA